MNNLSNIGESGFFPETIFLFLLCWCCFFLPTNTNPIDFINYYNRIASNQLFNTNRLVKTFLV